MKRKYTVDTLLEELFKDKEALKVLSKYRFPCLKCPFAAAELSKLKLGEVCKAYGIPVAELLKELNKENEKSKEEKKN
mgnify:CR=1 FL=1